MGVWTWFVFNHSTRAQRFCYSLQPNSSVRSPQLSLWSHTYCRATQWPLVHLNSSSVQGRSVGSRPVKDTSLWVNDAGALWTVERRRLCLKWKWLISDRRWPAVWIQRASELRTDTVMDSCGHIIMRFNKMTRYYPQHPINQCKAPCGSPTPMTSRFRRASQCPTSTLSPLKIICSDWCLSRLCNNSRQTPYPFCVVRHSNAVIGICGPPASSSSQGISH